jgi:hypothetical protein
MANETIEDWAPDIRSRTDEGAERESARSSPSPASARVAATVAADVLSLATASLVTGGAMVALGHVPGIRRLFEVFPSDGSTSMLLLLTLVPYWLFLLYAFGLYRASGASIRGVSIENTMRGFTALTVGSWLLFLLMVLLRGVDSPLGALAVFWAVASLAVPLGRWTARAVVWRRRAFAERVLIVGAGTVGHTLAAKIAKHPEYRIELVGFLEDGEPMPNGSGPEVPVIGSLRQLEQIIDRERVNRVILAFSQARHQQFLTVARICADHGVRVNIVPRLFEVLSSRAGVDDLEGIPLLDVAQVELSQLSMIVKRAFDLFVGGILTVLFLPWCALIAILIKVDSPGPVFFRQERMGRNGRVFRILKFRSMRVPARGPRGAQRVLRPDVQDKERPACDPPRQLSAAHQPGRTAAALQRGARQHEPGRPSPALGRRSEAVQGLGEEAAEHHARHHRPVAGDGTQRHPVRRDDQARLFLRHRLEPQLGHPPAAGDDSRRLRPPRRVLTAPPIGARSSLHLLRRILVPRVQLRKYSHAARRRQRR